MKDQVRLFFLKNLTAVKHFRLLLRLNYKSAFLILLKKGDETVTEQLLEEYIRDFHSTVFRLAYSYVKSHEDADDITQSAFVKLYLSSERFESAENVKAWLIRVTINLSRDLLRSGWHRHRSELSGDISVYPHADSGISECLSRLKPEYSSTLYLYYYEGYSVKEIAAMRKMNSATVRTRLARARSALKKILSEEDAL